MTNQATLKEMLDNAVHFGHKTSKWNPKMKQYIYGSRGGIHIIDITKTATLLENAMQFLSKASGEGATILFVGTKPQCSNVIKNTSKKCGAYYIIKKWVPGCLTNFSTIKTRIKRLKDLKAENKETQFEKYTKKEKGQLLKEISKLEDAFGGVEELKNTPKVLIVADAKRDIISITEAKKLGIPVVAITDTNSDPSLVNFPIPGNDDSIKSLTYILGKLEEAILKGKKGGNKKESIKEEKRKEESVKKETA